MERVQRSGRCATFKEVAREQAGIKASIRTIDQALSNIGGCNKISTSRGPDLIRQHT